MFLLAAILMILTLITGQTCDAVVAQKAILLQINKGVSDERILSDFLENDKEIIKNWLTDLRRSL